MKTGTKTIFLTVVPARSQLAAMRKHIWPVGWLDRSIPAMAWASDALMSTNTLLTARCPVVLIPAIHGAIAQYVDPRLRPETDR